MNCRKLVLAIFVVTVAAGCVDTGDEIETEEFRYESPSGFSLEGTSTSGDVKNYTFENLWSEIEVSVMDMNWTRTEFRNQSGFMLALMSGDYDANPEYKEIHGRNWTLLNASVETDNIAGKRMFFSTYHERKAYTFELTEISQVNETEFEIWGYSDFRRSVIATEFK